MAKCPRCGKEVEQGKGYCPFCGGEMPFPAYDSTQVRIAEQEYRTFIGRNADLYLNKFRRFQLGGTDTFAVTWHWPAFWLGFVWMLYRKMYLWALVAFFVSLTPVAFPLAMIGWGIVGNYLYYLHAKKKIMGFKDQQSLFPGILSLGELGGINRWVWYVGILFILLFLAVVILGLSLFFHFLKYPISSLPDILEI